MTVSQNPAVTISRKRDGKELSETEIREFILGVAGGEIPDYQASAFLMAVFFKGMSLDETIALTKAMLESGIRYDLSRIPGPKVDKHSTGGVGDKVSIVLAPLAAACGLKVPMMSGRGLGHSGGTLDKLESIDGFNAKIPQDHFEHLLKTLGCAMIGQSERIAPADKKLYALRDVTGTVECLPLIVASILSKKLAEGTESLVFDVKVGSGAFMKNREQAKKLARALLQVGKKSGLNCRALITDMNQPLGCTAGNALEIRECISVLRGEKHTDGCTADLKELTIQLCAHMLELGKEVRSLAEGRKLAHTRLADGSAWQHFQDMIVAQGGSLKQIQNPETLPKAPHRVEWKARARGTINRMDTAELGWIVVDIGGGRRKAEDRIDPAVGLEFHKKLGSRAQIGETLAVAHLASLDQAEALEARFHAAIDIGGVRKPAPKLIVETLG